MESAQVNKVEDIEQLCRDLLDENARILTILARWKVQKIARASTTVESDVKSVERELWDLVPETLYQEALKNANLGSG